MFSIMLLLLATLLHAVTYATTVQLPLYSMTLNDVNHNEIIKKYMSLMENNLLDQTVLKTTSELHDYSKLLLTKISIGNPAQEFTMILDLLTSNLWVSDLSCVTKSSCQTKTPFNSKVSNTYKINGKDVIVQNMYVTKATGFLGQDIVKMGSGVNQLVIEDCLFTQMTSLTNDFLNIKADGVLGLGIVENGHKSLLLNAIEHGKLDKSMLTIHLKRSTNYKDQMKGLLTYGDFDVTNCGEVIGTAPFDPKLSYNYKIDDISVSDKYLFNKQLTGLLYINAPIIGAPKIVVDGIAKAIGAVKDEKLGVYVLDCNHKYDSVKFGINGHKYEITSELFNYNIGLPNNKCLLAIIPTSVSETGPILMGSIFVSEYCHTIDLKNSLIYLSKSKNLNIV